MKSALISIVFLVAAVTGADYCSSNLCSGQAHIGCRNRGAFSNACPAGNTKMIAMTNWLREKIVHSHNTKRNTIASGRLAGFKPAKRMPTMRWNNELAYLASYNVKTCTFAHDKCRNTNEFRNSGQNLGKFWWKGGSYSDEQIILNLIEGWWAEYKYAKMSDLEKYPSSTSKTIGHFTVMTSDTNIAVGCAAIRFPEDGKNSLSFACNYASTNWIGKPLYKSGSPASKCSSGKNSRYSALCSGAEKIDPNVI